MTQQGWPQAPGAPIVPPCHGNPRMFDQATRECRQCAHQVTCRDRLDADRRSANQARVPPWQQQWHPQNNPAPAPVYQNPYAGYPQYPTPQQNHPPMQAAQWGPPQQYAQQMQHVPQQQIPMDYYGRVSDPLYTMVSSCPVPMRVQQPGESFWERVVKNAFLGSVERIFAEGMFAVRQMVMPGDPRTDSPQRREPDNGEG